MKNKLFAILLINSFMMIVIHEMIPHHHHEMADIELFSHQHHSNKQENNSETDNTNHFPFPAHHHVLASEGFDVVRVSNNLERESNFPFWFLVPDYLLRIPDAEPPENTFYSNFKVPKNSLPFIISPNAMRGSPSVT